MSQLDVTSLRVATHDVAKWITWKKCHSPLSQSLDTNTTSLWCIASKMRKDSVNQGKKERKWWWDNRSKNSQLPQSYLLENEIGSPIASDPNLIFQTKPSWANLIQLALHHLLKYARMKNHHAYVEPDTGSEGWVYFGTPIPMTKLAKLNSSQVRMRPRTRMGKCTCKVFPSARARNWNDVEAME